MELQSTGIHSSRQSCEPDVRSKKSRISSQLITTDHQILPRAITHKSLQPVAISLLSLYDGSRPLGDTSSTLLSPVFFLYEGTYQTVSKLRTKKDEVSSPSSTANLLVGAECYTMDAQLLGHGCVIAGMPAAVIDVHFLSGSSAVGDSSCPRWTGYDSCLRQCWPSHPRASFLEPISPPPNTHTPPTFLLQHA